MHTSQQPDDALALAYIRVATDAAKKTPEAAERYYVTPQRLAKLVREHRQPPKQYRVVSDDLAIAFIRIAGGVWDRFHFTSDRDEFVQSAVLHLMERPLSRANPKLNLFAFFTTCVVRFGQNVREKANVEQRRFSEYAEHVRESGGTIVHRRGKYDEEDLDG